MNPNAWQDLRIIGIEDGSFTEKSTKTLLVAVLLRKGLWIEDLKIGEITIDGLDATEKAIEMLKNWQFNIIMQAGVSFGGFNLVDPVKIYEIFKKPVIVVSRKKPDNIAIKNALLEHFEDWEQRWKVFERLGEVYEIKPFKNEPPLFMEIVGASPEWAERIIRLTTISSRIPEPVRVARLIARGLSSR